MHTARLSLATVAISAGLAHAGLTDFSANITASQVSPFPSSSTAVGGLVGTYDDLANTFIFAWSITGDLVGSPTSPGARLHMAPPGVNGPVVYTFSEPDGSWATVGTSRWSDLSAQEVNALFAGDVYVSFHTDAFPGGEIRGQVTVVPSGATLAPAAIGLLGAARRRRRA